MASTQSIRELAEPALASSGLELWDVELSGDVVRILVDRPGGVDLDTLSAASGVLSPLLDSHPEAAPAGRYQLEVSSPGVERTLRTPEQFRRYLGSDLNVKTAVAVQGARRHHGRLLEAGEDGIVVEPRDAAAGTRVELPYDQIERARTVLVWGPSPKGPGQSSGKGHKPASRRQTAAPASVDRELKDAGS